MKRLFILGLILVLALALAPGTIAVADKAPAVVYLKPSGQTTTVGGLANVEVWVNNVTDFYGIQFELQFDPLILDFVDVVRGAAFPLANSVNPVHNAVGNRVNFAANLFGVAAPAPNSNLHVATITFRGRAIGTSSLIWPTTSSTVVANTGGFPIPHLQQGGSITVQSLVDVFGHAFLGGRIFPVPGHGNIGVDFLGPSGVLSTTTAADGYYGFQQVKTGTYNLHMNHKFYLTTHLKSCLVGAPGPIELPAVTLVPGDLNADQRIDIFDLVTAASPGTFGSTAPAALAAADVNGDGVVNILDLVLIGVNFGKLGPIVQPC